MEALIEDELNVDDSDTPGRTRTLSSRGMSYELDNISRQFISLKAVTEYTLGLISTHASDEVVRTKYSLWMDKFERYIEKHQELMARLPSEEKDTYTQQFEDRDAYLQNFKRTIEKYLSTRTVTRSASNRSHSSRQSEASSQNSVLSKISAKKMAEEQRKAELEHIKEALQKKRKLELAKVQLQIEEEELKLSTEIAVSNAKSKVLEKYEQLEYAKSESSHSGSQIRQVNPIQQAEKLTETLNPDAQPFLPEIRIIDDHNKASINVASNTNIHRTFVSNPRTFATTRYDDSQIVNNIQQENSPLESDKNNSNSEAIQAIVRNLRKPTPDIKRFGGDPLEFRRFVRQFTAKVVQNSDSEDEKMNYLEQFTYGEANKVVTGFSHMINEFAYKAAMQQLEERYGGSDIVASAFIKKALDWPAFKANDPKALDDFSLFLIECENAAYSIDALKILEYAENIKRLMCKLPFHLHDRWRNVVLRMKTNNQPIRFSHFVEFVKSEAKKVNDFTYGTKAVNVKGIKEEPRDSFKGHRQNTRMNVLAANLESSKRSIYHSVKECSYCKSKDHNLEQCSAILRLDHQKRYEHLKALALCFGCLKKGRMTKKCTNRL